jgi:hypothetical protein
LQLEKPWNEAMTHLDLPLGTLLSLAVRENEPAIFSFVETVCFTLGIEPHQYPNPLASFNPEVPEISHSSYIYVSPMITKSEATKLLRQPTEEFLQLTDLEMGQCRAVIHLVETELKSIVLDPVKNAETIGFDVPQPNTIDSIPQSFAEKFKLRFWERTQVGASASATAIRNLLDVSSKLERPKHNLVLLSLLALMEKQGVGLSPGNVYTLLRLWLRGENQLSDQLRQVFPSDLETWNHISKVRENVIPIIGTEGITIGTFNNLTSKLKKELKSLDSRSALGELIEGFTITFP